MEAETRRPQFGNRLLQDENDVFKHNAWDNIQWNEEQEQSAKKKVSENSEIIMTKSEISKLEEEAFDQWNAFYSIHQNRFFKDRHWLFTEFTELSPNCSSNSNGEITDNEYCTESKLDTTRDLSDDLVLAELRTNESYVGEHSSTRILEVGCGVGNTVFPILQNNKDSGLFVYCCDFSETGIDILKLSDEYDKQRCLAFVYDVTKNDKVPPPFPDESLDIIICIFVLSALQPDKMEIAVKQLSKFLKPGGLLLFRDYGRYDMAQLRFKKGRCVGDNFYARGDGTFCYFFTQDDVRKLMESAGLVEIQNTVDRRLQVNRGKQLTMYRVWIQARYKKPLPSG